MQQKNRLRCLALLFVGSNYWTAAFILPSSSSSSTLQANHGNHPQQQCRVLMGKDNHDDEHDNINLPARNNNNNGQPLSRSAFLSSSLIAALAVTVSAATATPAEAAQAKAKAPMVPTTTPPLPTGLNKIETEIETKIADKSNNNDNNSQTTLEESISGFIAGAALSATKTIVKYPLDTATVRLQMPASQYSVFEPLELLNGSFQGIAFPLVSNIPAGAIFFAVKDATKEFLKESTTGGGAGLPKWASTSLAVLAATFPYMAIRNPSEVVKVRRQAGIEGYGEGVSAMEAFQKVRQGSSSNSTEDGSSGSGITGDFYVGYLENVCYTYPADVLKFVAYESLSGGRKNLPPAEGAVYGAAATAIAQFITTPLDVVRNRAMAKERAAVKVGSENGSELVEDPPSYFESLSKIANEEGLKGLFAGVTPRVGKAILSGAIQFATYEETKQAIAKSFQRNKNRWCGVGRNWLNEGD